MSKKGFIQSAEHKRKNSLSKMGSKKPMFGRKLSLETKNKMSLKKEGEKSLFWKGGIFNKDKKAWRKNYNKKRLENKDAYERKLWLNNKRRAIKMNNGGTHSLGEWQKLKAQYNWSCPDCKESEPKIKLSVDHVIPISKGGSDNIENIQPLCRSCNSKKHTKQHRYEI